jgi:hypothetical protein
MRTAAHLGVALALGGGFGGGIYEFDHTSKAPAFENRAQVAACARELGVHAVTASVVPGDCEPFKPDFQHVETEVTAYQPYGDALSIAANNSPNSATGSTTVHETSTSYTLLPASTFKKTMTTQKATWETNNNFTNGDGLTVGLLVGGVSLLFSVALTGRKRTRKIPANHAASKYN